MQNRRIWFHFLRRNFSDKIITKYSQKRGYEGKLMRGVGVQ
jgi:hypothetical protein